jgi:RimJ/RimL family protein N-acetyltransferase
VKPPVLETERLRLRPFAPSDAPEVQRLAGAREIADTTKRIPHPYRDGVAEAWIATHAALHEANRALTLAIERRGAALLGAIDLRLEEENSNAEIGYWIRVDEWGRGYATEAARAVIDHGFAALGLHRIWAGHFERNPASGRVLEKLGMAREGVLRAHVRKWGRFENLVVRAILRPEWEKRRENARAGGAA